VRNLRIVKNGHGIFFFKTKTSLIENVTASDNNYGIYLQESSGNVIKNNYCPENWVGIGLQESSNNLVEKNIAINCEKGFSLYEASQSKIEGNTLEGNLYGIRLFSSHYNNFSHNNFIGNTEQADLIISYQNIWDNGFEGNYWSDFVSSDTNKDGLGDNPKDVDGTNRDNYPFLGLIHSFNIDYGESPQQIMVASNSTILNLTFENNSIRLTVNGTNGTAGFCRIYIPHLLIEPEISVIIDGGLIEVLHPNYSLFDDGINRWIFFAYRHSTHEIVIVPEIWLAPIFLILVGMAICRFLWKK
jgi:parallel beta-helix repeat protein